MESLHIQTMEKSQKHLEKKEQRTLTFTYVKIYCKARVIKTGQYWHKDIQIDPMKQNENQEINLLVCGQVIFDMGTKTTIQWGKDNLFKK